MSTRTLGMCDSCQEFDMTTEPTGLGDEELCQSCSWLRQLAVDSIREREMARPEVETAIWEENTSPGMAEDSIAYRARTALTRAAIRAAEDPNAPFTDVVQAAFLAARAEGGE